MEKLLLGLTLIFIVTYLWYVSLVKKRNTALEALSGIDVQLTKRADLVPNILKIAKRFMEHEKSLLTEITELRTQLSHNYNKADPSAVKEHLVQAERLNDKMSTLMVNVENYPELKSDNTMLQAMQTYNEVEAHISAARRFYNSAVSELNTAVEIFPGSIIASMASIKVMPFYEVSEAAKAPVDAAEYL
ncbi:MULTISPECIES: LemA family protein [unclassified Shewanella]|jgi:LemA protein|uniref:LemA family protein n=1 Tax=Shewanella TaxID=22 RepID=UPI000E942B1D|nr:MULTISPECIES: LemA family protein [unclassified Shewanella]MBI1674146.1 LemA family protein [Shewanella sp. DW31]MCU7986580.1 LemA family protein [Shewanella sp. SW24]MCU7999113.1 LemA family protein [Shewanella sp. SM95]MCU8002589.1 LemA family protein [Shewanella sp. SM96]MCU8010110.1 LemA family protein [Shewanella sp. SM87]